MSGSSTFCFSLSNSADSFHDFFFVCVCDLFQILLPWLTLSVICNESLANVMETGYLFYPFEHLAFSSIMSNEPTFCEWINLTMASPLEGWVNDTLQQGHLEFPGVMIKLLPPCHKLQSHPYPVVSMLSEAKRLSRPPKIKFSQRHPVLASWIMLLFLFLFSA